MLASSRPLEFFFAWGAPRGWPGAPFAVGGRRRLFVPFLALRLARGRKRHGAMIFCRRKFFSHHGHDDGVLVHGV